MQLRVAGARGAVPKSRRDETTARQPGDAVLAPPCLAGLPFQIAQCCGDRGVVRPTDFEHQRGVAEGEQQRDTLGRGEREVVARQPVRSPQGQDRPLRIRR